MELSLGRRADYAIRATLDLARHHDGKLRKSRDIGQATEVPVSYLPQILALLVRAGIASSTAGRRGGYGLTRPPGEISLFDVVTAVDGDVSASICVLRGGVCQAETACAVHIPWAKAQMALTEQLAATTFEQVAELDELLELGELEFPPGLAPPALAL